MFTQTERLILLNQYRILAKLEPDQGWGKFATILEQGYSTRYADLTEYLYEELSASDTKFVEDAMALYDALQRPYVDGNEAVPVDLTFPGFDGNNEGGLLGYARFLRSEGRWNFLVTGADDLNSHFPTRQFYAKRIAIWDSEGRPYPANEATYEAIAKA